MDDTKPAPSERRADLSTVYPFVDAERLPQAETEVPAEWKVGDLILALYEVTGILGEGGMGRVYKVHHRGWNADLAVKSPRPETFAKQGGKEAFVREAETWVDLGLHPRSITPPTRSGTVGSRCRRGTQPPFRIPIASKIGSRQPRNCGKR